MLRTMTTGLLHGVLPRGCMYCALGEKIVVFITGICGEDCWYCPVSRTKYGRDVVYVNDLRVGELREIALEAHRLRAKGAGITGGDPLSVPERVVRVIRMLKEEMGRGFHIHLYTTGRRLNKSILRALVDAGLDEIRFHTYSWELYRRARMALGIGIDAGLELPFIPLPEYMGFLEKLIMQADRDGFAFINLDELEVSEANRENVLLHGLSPRGLTVEGIRDAAIEFMSRVRERVERITIHYCTVEYKDNIQFRRRNMRKSVLLSSIRSVVTMDGTYIVFRTMDSGEIWPQHAVSYREYYVEEYMPTETYGVINKRLVTRGSR